MLLTLACSASFVIYLTVRMTFEILSGSHQSQTRPAPSDVPATSSRVRPIVAAVDNNAKALSTGVGALGAVEISGPWDPIAGRLNPETVQKIERVMAIGMSMRDTAGNPCPHPIAPRVALAIVEALQGQQQAPRPSAGPTDRDGERAQTLATPPV